MVVNVACVFLILHAREISHDGENIFLKIWSIKLKKIRATVQPSILEVFE